MYKIESVTKRAARGPLGFNIRPVDACAPPFRGDAAGQEGFVGRRGVDHGWARPGSEFGQVFDFGRHCPETGKAFQPQSNRDWDDVEGSETERVVSGFAEGTMITTPDGDVPVEQLAVGDRVITRDHGSQRVRWVGRTLLKPDVLQDRPELRPMRIAKGALGNGLPQQNLLVGPEHRLLVTSDMVSLYFEVQEVFVTARHLPELSGVEVAPDVPAVNFIHVMFDEHELVLTNGTWSESFQPDGAALRGLEADQRRDLFAAFPDLRRKAGRSLYFSARKCLTRQEVLLLRA